MIMIVMKYLARPPIQLLTSPKERPTADERNLSLCKSTPLIQLWCNIIYGWEFTDKLNILIFDNFHWNEDRQFLNYSLKLKESYDKISVVFTKDIGTRMWWKMYCGKLYMFSHLEMCGCRRFRLPKVVNISWRQREGFSETTTHTPYFKSSLF
jgi:hypothetical protein